MIGCEERISGASPGTNHVSFTYDANGNRTAVVDSYGNRTEYTYDGEDRLTETTYDDGTTDTAWIYEADPEA